MTDTKSNQFTLKKGNTIKETDIDRYTILELLCKGGMAEIYIAKEIFTTKQVSLRDKVLIKMLSPEQYFEMAPYFKAEAEIMQTLDHKGIPKLLDHFEWSRVKKAGEGMLANMQFEDKSYVLVQEFIDGITLEEILKKKNGKSGENRRTDTATGGKTNLAPQSDGSGSEPDKNGSDIKQSKKKYKGLAEHEVVDIALKVGEILEYCHSRKTSDGRDAPVIHKDIKPSNIMIKENGEIILIDFGISTKIPDCETQIFSEKPGVGTPGYCPLEQYTNIVPKPAMDIYALGATMFELITGKSPIMAQDRLGEEKVEFPRHKKISKSLEPILEKMLAMSAKDRYQTIKEVITDLEKARPQLLPLGKKIQENAMNYVKQVQEGFLLRKISQLEKAGDPNSVAKASNLANDKGWYELSAEIYEREYLRKQNGICLETAVCILKVRGLEEKALELCKKYPNNLNTYLNIGVDLAQQLLKYDVALEMLENYFYEMNEKSTHGLEQKIERIAMLANKPGRAIQAYEHIGNLSAAANIAEQNKMYDKAIELRHKARQFSEEARLLVFVGREKEAMTQYRFAGYTAEALKLAQKLGLVEEQIAISIQEQNYKYAGELIEGLGNDERALQFYSSNRFENDAGRIAEKMQDYATAMQHYQLALHERKSHKKHINVARMAEKLEKWEDAISNYEAARELSKAAETSEVASQKSKDNKEKIGFLVDAARLWAIDGNGIKSAECCEKYGNIEEAMGNATSARDSLETAAERYADFGEPDRASPIYLKLGRPLDAAKCFATTNPERAAQILEDVKDYTNAFHMLMINYKLEPAKALLQRLRDAGNTTELVLNEEILKLSEQLVQEFGVGKEYITNIYEKSINEGAGMAEGHAQLLGLHATDGKLELYRKTPQFKRAMVTFAALESFKKGKDTKLKVPEVYIKLGRIKEGADYTEAQKLYDKAVECAEKAGNKDRVMELCEKSGDYKGLIEIMKKEKGDDATLIFLAKKKLFREATEFATSDTLKKSYAREGVEYYKELELWLEAGEVAEAGHLYGEAAEMYKRAGNYEKMNEMLNTPVKTHINDRAKEQQETQEMQTTSLRHHLVDEIDDAVRKLELR